MMRVACYLEDSVGVVCKPATFPLLANAVSMVLASDPVEAEAQEKPPSLKSDNGKVIVD